MDVEHPLPKIEDMLATVGPAKYFSVIEFSQAYLQMKLTKESKDLCVLNTPKGLYRMLRMPYGIKNAASIFQKEMDFLLSEVEGVKCLLDDVLIFSETENQALDRLEKVLNIIENA